VAPRGFHPARIDEKGRLKLPAVFHEYLSQLGEKKVFVTTIDTVTARLYTSSVWAVNETFFENPGEDAAEWAESVAFVARHYGADSEIDSQGRLLVPQELRKDLGIENQAVWLGYDKGAIAIYGESMYQQKLAASKAQLPVAVSGLVRKSLLK